MMFVASIGEVKKRGSGPWGKNNKKKSEAAIVSYEKRP